MAAKTVTLDKRIYKPGAVKAAIKDYSGVSDMSMESEGEAIVVTIGNWPEEYEDTMEFEFCNYVLWKMRG